MFWLRSNTVWKQHGKTSDALNITPTLLKTFTCIFKKLVRLYIHRSLTNRTSSLLKGRNLYKEMAVLLGESSQALPL